MAELSHELRAFQRLVRVVAAGPQDATALVERICAEMRAGFALARTDFLEDDELAAQHPLVERAREQQAAACDGRRVAAPLLLDGNCLGHLIGDRAGAPLDLDRTSLELLTALAAVAAVLLDRARHVGRLERSLAARTQFVSLASHELRTPIAVVHGIVATLHLRGDELEPQQLRELRETAFEQTGRLAQLTDQLLDLSRLETGPAAPRKERFRPRELVDTLLPRIAPDRRDQISVEIDPAAELVCDPDALERVLSNLIVNALRYGAPPVRVSAEGAGSTRIVVADAGAGVPEELQPRLFDRFTRGRRDVAGSGLGLSIARSYAELLGGRLRYEHAVPHGARFSLTLPLSTAAKRSVRRR